MTVTQLNEKSTSAQTSQHASKGAIRFWIVASALTLLFDIAATSYAVLKIVEASREIGFFSGILVLASFGVVAGVIVMSSTLWRVIRYTRSLMNTALPEK